MRRLSRIINAALTPIYVQQRCWAEAASTSAPLMIHKHAFLLPSSRHRQIIVDTETRGYSSDHTRQGPAPPVPSLHSTPGTEHATSSPLPATTSQERDITRDLPPPERVHAEAAPQQHWLDRRAPSVRQWLQSKSLDWWLRGVQARCRQYPQLAAREDLVRRLVLEQYRQIMQKHSAAAVDGRAETHLQVAALLLASHKVLGPWIRDPQELLALLREHNGGKASSLLRFMLRFTLWLSFDPFAWQVARLRGLALDMGQGFDAQLHQGPREAVLDIKKCFYHNIFSMEGVPELTACTCCSIDSMWFEGLESHGVHFQKPKCLWKEDCSCSLIVSKT